MYAANARKGPVTPRAFALSLVFHAVLFLVLWCIGALSFRHKEEVIPIDLTIVPPWAQQDLNDPDPDPNPPPAPQPEKVQPKPPPEPKVEKIEPKVDAVEKVVEKKKDPPKPKDQPKKVDLREEAKFVKTPVKPPEPVNLRNEATKVIPLPPTIQRTGKGTAHDKPLSQEEFMKKMMEGYRVGSRNQIANDEATRCISLITAAIRRECEKDSFKWHQNLGSVQLELKFGAGGRILGYKLVGSSGDAGIDQMVLRAVGRLGSIAGLSAPFLEQYPVVGALIEPLQR